MKVDIYDPPMCCPTGLCGPALDPVLMKMNDAILALKKQGISIERYGLAQNPKEFLSNETVAGLLHRNGRSVLPVIFVNGTLFKTGAYPTYDELCAALGIEPLKQKPISLISG